MASGLTPRGTHARIGHHNDAAGVVLLAAVPAAASGWTVVPAPPSDGGLFNAVPARTGTDAWAVGDLSATTPLIARWNGSAWARVKAPRLGATEELDSGSATPGGTITWAFGRRTSSTGVVSDLALRNGQGEVSAQVTPGRAARVRFTLAWWGTISSASMAGRPRSPRTSPPGAGGDG